MAKENAIGVPLDVDLGGTGAVTHTTYAVLTGGTTATNPVQSIASVGTAAQVLTSNGAGALPTFQAAAASGVGSYVYISSVTASTDATVNFEGLDSTYEYYEIILRSVIPVTDGSMYLNMRVGTGATPTYQSGVSDYGWDNAFLGGTASDQADSEMRIFGFIGGDTNEFGLSATIKIFDPSSASTYTSFSMLGLGISNAGSIITFNSSSHYISTTAVTAVQFLFTSGNIESGVFDLYGIKTS